MTAATVAEAGPEGVGYRTGLPKLVAESAGLQLMTATLRLCASRRPVRVGPALPAGRCESARCTKCCAAQWLRLHPRALCEMPEKILECEVSRIESFPDGTFARRAGTVCRIGVGRLETVVGLHYVNRLRVDCQQL